MISFASAHSTVNSAATTSVTIASVPPAAGSNRVMIVGIAWETANDPASITSVTWGGVALTFLGRQRCVVSTAENAMELWYLNDASFPASSGDVVVTANVDLANDLGAIALQYTGAQPVSASSTFLGGQNTTVGADQTMSVSGSATATVVSVGTNGDDVATVLTKSAAETLRKSDNGNGFTIAAADQGATGSYTSSWTATAATRLAMGVVELVPAPKSGLRTTRQNAQGVTRGMLN